MIIISKDKRWVSFGRTRQKVSDLSPELRARLGIEELPEDNEDEVYEVSRKIKRKSKSEVRREDEIDSSNSSERERYHKKQDTNMDIVMKFIGWNLGRAWVKLTK